MFRSIFSRIRNKLFHSTTLVLISWIILFISMLSAYYLFLDSLYIVDEVYDASGPRELANIEKITIRVIAPQRAEDLNKFVLSYSVCPVVEEIQIVWNQNIAYPLESSFKYPHTHSRVVFNSNPLHFITTTESILLLDADVFVSCVDLRFSQTVWRSSQDAVVGYFPRLYGSVGDRVQTSSAQKLVPERGETQQYEVRPHQYLGLSEVLWSASYSLMLASGALLKTEYVQEFHKSAPVGDLLAQHPQCFDLAVSVFAASRGAPAPIFVDVQYSIERGVYLSSYASVLANLQQSGAVNNVPSSAAETTRGSSHLKGGREQRPLSDEQRGHCISLAMQAFKMVHLPIAQHKSVVAKRQWVW